MNELRWDWDVCVVKLTVKFCVLQKTQKIDLLKNQPQTIQERSERILGLNFKNLKNFHLTFSFCYSLSYKRIQSFNFNFIVSFFLFPLQNLKNQIMTTNLVIIFWNFLFTIASLYLILSSSKRKNGSLISSWMNIIKMEEERRNKEKLKLKICREKFMLLQQSHFFSFLLTF